MRVSFGSARAVELSLIRRVFLVDRCHRMLGARVKFRCVMVALLGFLIPGLDSCPDIGLRWFICAP